MAATQGVEGWSNKKWTLQVVWIYCKMHCIYINLVTYFEDMNIKCICIYDRKRRDEEKACYGKLLGCFYDEGPFDYLDMLPSPPELVNIN